MITSILSALARFAIGEKIVVERLTLPVRRLHPDLDGFRIVQLSDLHAEPYTRFSFLEEAVAMANALEPDLTVLTGDYVTTNAAAIHTLAPLLGELRARHGVYGVLGNHDMWTDPHMVRRALARHGVTVLENAGVLLSQGAGRLWLAGLEDGREGAPNAVAALRGAPEDAPAILLLHEPDLADLHLRDPRFFLQLSGHSHGGQIRLAGRRPPVLPYLGSKYPSGLYEVNGAALYTNRGLGYITLPVRINCAPEITEITLRAA